MLKRTLITLIFTLLFPAWVIANDIILFGILSNSYQFEQLKNALSYFPTKKYQLRNFQGNMPKNRAFDFMNNDEELDVIFGGATIERESKGLPIRIPIFKGLNGWRIPLINKNQHKLFATIDSKVKFKQLIPGQYYSWSDVKVLESNNIHVAKTSDYEGLFQMLDRERIDYFPLSALEIFSELEPRKHLNITIDTSTLIHYPTAYYFYVAKNNNELASDISLGLEKAISDGSFNKLFIKYHGEILNLIKSTNQKTFLLNNPYLSNKTPFAQKNLWVDFSPTSNIIN